MSMVRRLIEIPSLVCSFLIICKAY